MNTFAQIKPIAQYDKVSYYSVCIEESQLSIFEEFLQNHTEKNTNKLNHILEWIKIIGTKYGAQSHLFRPEAETADASALPPKGIGRKPHFIENHEKKANNLRLYCLRANENVVFLFNGAIKTTKYAQDCPNVRQHFKLANQLSKSIDNAFINKEIVWNVDFTQIDFEKDFKLYY